MGKKQERARKKETFFRERFALRNWVQLMVKKEGDSENGYAVPEKGGK